jgi:hypothetical protein
MRFRPLSSFTIRLRGPALDRRIAEGADPAEDRILGQRAEQLTSDSNRRELASWIERVVDAADQPDLPRRTVVPLQREAIREARPLLLSLARDLSQVGEPVSPRGIARARQLLTDGASPLYGCPGLVCAANGDELNLTVRHVRTTLALH